MMPRPSRPGRAGVTLVELVISIVLVTIVSGMLAVTLREGFAVYAAAQGRKSALQE
ncbi:MAG: hypothetical protein E4H38_08460, partial [Gemmatimonadales bacterium]